jgi:hypothetical protein
MPGRLAERRRVGILSAASRPWTALLAAALAVLVTGCSAAPGSSLPPASLSISNETTIDVTLVVNGSVIETVPAGGREDSVSAPLPPLPWSVETRSPSGRVLSQLTVKAGDVVYTTPDASGHSTAKGDGIRVDLACGRLDVWSGPPMLGPAPNPSLPGAPCD